MTPGARIAASALLLLPWTVACGGGEPAATPEEEAAASDTGAMDGLTREELERQVQPMTPERARELGIIDTTEGAPPSPVGPQEPIQGTPSPVGPGDTAVPPRGGAGATGGPP